ncbi:hydroxyacid-oxoacid transhydrogenase [Pyrolobus fumarii]|uniref:hydroxyacid-oxoacid transhydrogenase n=1 Tax=Pyrolobus fumarii TaxID=54252 RepID=UPI000A962C55|nr:hydroxyacid-oxoacid transhydrogenase [Pyrolobus fumarii]
MGTLGLRRYNPFYPGREGRLLGVLGLFLPPTSYADNVFEFRTPRVKFGVGVLNELGYELERLKARKLFVVTTRGWVRRGLIQRIEKLLPEGVEMEYFSDVEPEPSDSNVEQLADAMRKFGPDAILAVGGGSVIDAAKVAAVLERYGGRVRDYVAPPYGAGKPVPGPIKPLIAVPTTAGTGSEVTSVAVVTLPDLKVKVGVRSDELRPYLALLDPELTLTMPKKVTVDTAMDALTHAVEAYMAIPFYARPKPETPAKRPVYHGSNPITDALAEKAIELIGRYLRRAAYNGQTDIEARAGMLLASNLAGLAFGNAGTSLAHAASYPLGGRYKLTHGEAVGILLPAVLEFNAPADYCKATKVGELLSGEKPPCRCCPEGAKWAADKIRELQKDVGFTPGLEAVGVDPNDIPAMAEETLKQKALLALNPRPVTAKDVEWIYRRAWRNY